MIKTFYIMSRKILINKVEYVRDLMTKTKNVKMNYVQ
jgi:hypothetical protein